MMKSFYKVRDYKSVNRWYLSTVIGCFIFPIGLLLLIVNTCFEVKCGTEKNRSILYSGIGAIVFGGFMTTYIGSVSYMGDLSGSYILILEFIPPIIMGIYMLILYYILTNRAMNMNKFILLIQQEHITSITMIAEITGLKLQRAINVLKRIIAMGLLDGAEIDESSKKIMFKKCVWAKQRVICMNCGAELVVDFGQTLVCEYCGGALQVERIKE